MHDTHVNPDAHLDSSLSINHTAVGGSPGGFPGVGSVSLFLADSLFYAALGERFLMGSVGLSYT